MTNRSITFLQILAIGFIFSATAVGWFTLGSALTLRTQSSAAQLDASVAAGWGPPLTQPHPTGWYRSPTGEGGRRTILPATSEVVVSLAYDPKQKGLLWYRTYDVDFSGRYQFRNPTPITQTLYVSFRLPPEGKTFTNFSLQLGEEAPLSASPQKGAITRAVVVPPGGETQLAIRYRTRGTDSWRYDLEGIERVSGFRLSMRTDFREIDFPLGVASPSERESTEAGWDLLWDYPDVLGPQSAGLAMPNVLNAGPVAARIAFFAPVSLLFFFAVLLILGAVRGITLHPMNYFFLAAGCFAFQLLFAYLVDLLPIGWSFAIGAGVSLLLVNGYLALVAGRRLLVISLPAQAAYMVLFSYSFFFDGLTGITITLGAVATLAILMLVTARIQWQEIFRRPQAPAVPPLPKNA